MENLDAASFSADAAPGDAAVPEGSDTPNDLGELFDLVEGKNEDGTPKVRKVAKEDLLKFAQKGLGADTTFQEAARAREEAAATKAKMAQLAKLMQDDPFKVLQAFGKDPKQYVSNFFEKQLQESLIDPKDRELSQLKERLSRFESEAQERARLEEENQIKSKAAEVKAAVLSKIDQALSVTGVPKTPRTVAEIGRYMQSLVGKTGPDGQPINVLNFPVEKIVKHIQSTRTAEFQDIFGALDDDTLISSLDQKLVERIGKALSKRLAGQTLPVKVPVVKPEVSSVDQAKVNRQKIEEDLQARIKRLDAEWKKMNPGA